MVSLLDELTDQMVDVVPTDDDVDVPMMPNKAQEPGTHTGAWQEDRCDVPTEEDWECGTHGHTTNYEEQF